MAQTDPDGADWLTDLLRADAAALNAEVETFDKDAFLDRVFGTLREPDTDGSALPALRPDHS